MEENLCLVRKVSHFNGVAFLFIERKQVSSFLSAASEHRYHLALRHFRIWVFGKMQSSCGLWPSEVRVMRLLRENVCKLGQDRGRIFVTCKGGEGWRFTTEPYYNGIPSDLNILLVQTCCHLTQLLDK